MQKFSIEKKVNLIILLILVAGAVITFFIYRNETTGNYNALKSEVQQDAKLFSQVINNAVKTQIAFIKSTRHFFMASDFVSNKEFETFTSSYLKTGKGITEIIWSKRVEHKDKKIFEKNMSELCRERFIIRGVSAYGQEQELSDKETYFPISYIVTNKKLLKNIKGYDLELLDCFPEYVFEKTSENPILCVCTHIQKFFPGRKIYMLIMSVPGKGNSPGQSKTDGILLMAIDFELMFSELESSLPLEYINFDIYENNNSKEKIIFRGQKNSHDIGFKDMESTFRIVDSNLYIRIMPNENVRKNYVKIGNFATIPIGIITTFLIMLFIRSILLKKKYSEKLIAERTHELEKALALQNSIFNNSAAGIIITEENYTVTDINDNACIIFGYMHEEIKNKNIKLLCKTNNDFNAIAKTLQNTESIVGIELELLRKDSSTALCFISINTIAQDDKTLKIWIIHDITENRRIQSKIIEQEENIKIFFEAAASLIFIIDKNMNILYSNKTSEEKTNYTIEELRNMKITDLYSPEHRIRAEAEFSNIIENNFDKCTLPIKNKNGKIIPVDNKTISGKWHGQEVLFIIYNDISGIEAEHKKFEKAFQNNATPMLITCIDTGEFIEVNDSFIRLFGYQRHELIGKNTPDLLYDKPEERIKIIKHVKNHGYLKNYFTCFHDKHGEKKDILLNIEIINISDKSYFLSSLVDMTAIKKTEKSLKESEERWKFALEGSGDGIWDWEVNSNNLFYSARAKALLGYENDELEGSYNDFLSRLHPDDKINTLNAIQTYLEGKTEIYQSEHRIRNKGGSYIWVLARGKTILYDDNGKAKRIIGTLTDMTWHKQVEDELRKARTEADSANQAKSRFLANMSHEIRTPLHGIIGLTELVLTTELMENQQKYLESLKTSAYSLLDILNEILDISKIESGSFKASEVDFDIYSLLEKSITIFSAKSLEKEIELILDIKPEFPDILTGDSVRIRQIISNLLSNAVKFTHHGEIVISVKKSKVQLPDTNKILIDISVKDTGIGIPAEKIAYIFERFNQVDDSISRNYGGSGLGLTISKSLAEMMGGNLTVSSQENHGSIFTLTIPLQTGNAEIKNWNKKIRYQKVLIVDENQTLLGVLAGIMKSFNVECTTSNSYGDALNIFNLSLNGDSPYDLVFVDMSNQSPEFFTLIKNFRIPSKNSPPRIVPFISIANTAKRENIEKLHLDRFLVKPLKLTDLYSVLTQDPESVTEIQKLENPPHTVNSNSKKYKILVVEDNPINTMVIVDILKNMGFDTVSTTNGQDAIKKYQMHKFDLIFMDIHIPGMDGFEITSRIRAIEKTDRNVPIIALSAETRKEEIEKTLKKGIDHYICKPFSISDITYTINKFLPGTISAEKYTENSKSAAKDNSSIFDIETFLMMINNNPETYKKLITMARKEIPLSLEKIKKSIEQNSYKDIIFYTHELKGTSSNLRAMKITAAAAEIEQKAKDEKPMEEMMIQLEQLYLYFAEYMTIAEKQMPS